MLTSRQTTTALSPYTFFLSEVLSNRPHENLETLNKHSTKNTDTAAWDLYRALKKISTELNWGGSCCWHQSSWYQTRSLLPSASLSTSSILNCCPTFTWLKHFSTHWNFSLIRYSINLLETKLVSQPAATGSYLWLMSASCSGTAIQKEGLCIEMKKVSRHD